MRLLLLVMALWFTGCHHCMQTRPSCSLEPYALFEFVNHTDTDKRTYVQRLHDGKKIEEPIANLVEARTVHLYRVPPGYYEFGVRMPNGDRAWQTQDSVGACETITVPMRLRRENLVERQELDKKEGERIRPRRTPSNN
jgi:hypothetical protein